MWLVLCICWKCAVSEFDCKTENVTSRFSVTRHQNSLLIRLVTIHVPYIFWIFIFFRQKGQLAELVKSCLWELWACLFDSIIPQLFSFCTWKFWSFIVGNYRWRIGGSAVGSFVLLLFHNFFFLINWHSHSLGSRPSWALIYFIFNGKAINSVILLIITKNGPNLSVWQPRVNPINWKHLFAINLVAQWMESGLGGEWIDFTTCLFFLWPKCM